MSKFTVPMLLASAALFAAVPANAQYGSQGNYDQSAPGQSYDQSGGGSYAPSGNYQDQRPRHQRGGHMSMEQRAMMRAEMRQQVHNIPREQRKAYRQQLKSQWRSMDPGQREQKFAEMERHWNALPAETRDRIMTRMSQHNHRGRGQGQQGDSQYQNSGNQYRNGGARNRDRGESQDNETYSDQ